MAEVKRPEVMVGRRTIVRGSLKSGGYARRSSWIS